MQHENREEHIDFVLPFHLAEAGIRGRAARLGRLLDEIFGRWAYPSEVESAVAETVLLAALIGQIINVKWKLSLQVRGDGPVRLVNSDYIAPERAAGHARIRSFASFDAERLGHWNKPDLMFGNGYFAVLVDRGDGKEPYQGLVPLEGRGLSECAEAYFMHSEQLPTRFVLAATQRSSEGSSGCWRAGGVMIQHMPKPSPPAMAGRINGSGGVNELGKIQGDSDMENWSRACALLDTANDVELTDDSVSLASLLFRLFHEEKPRAYDRQPLKFGCTCSADKVRQGLSIYSAKDIATMTTVEGLVTADCQFCGAHYEFNPGELGFEATAGFGSGDG